MNAGARTLGHSPLFKFDPDVPQKCSQHVCVRRLQGESDVANRRRSFTFKKKKSICTFQMDMLSQPVRVPSVQHCARFLATVQNRPVQTARFKLISIQFYFRTHEGFSLSAKPKQVARSLRLHVFFLSLFLLQFRCPRSS